MTRGKILRHFVPQNDRPVSCPPDYVYTQKSAAAFAAALFNVSIKSVIVILSGGTAGVEGSQALKSVQGATFEIFRLRLDKQGLRRTFPARRDRSSERQDGFMKNRLCLHAKERRGRSRGALLLPVLICPRALRSAWQGSRTEAPARRACQDGRSCPPAACAPRPRRRRWRSWR